MLQKATKREIQTVHIHDMSNAQKLADYKKQFDMQYVDEHALTALMQNSTTVDQRDAFRTWTGSAYRPINAYYRTGAAVDEGYKRTGQIIHDYLNTCEYPQMYVRRGADYEYITKIYGSDKWKKDPALLLNYRLTDKGFLATTPNKREVLAGR